MKRLTAILAAALATTGLHAQTDSLAPGPAASLVEVTGPATSLAEELSEVVVTGTRQATSVRHLPMTVTVVGRQQLTEQNQTSVLPTLMQQVPSLLVTSRGMMGYGVSTGAAGGINLRGMASGSGQMLVLIDGHPQYQGVYGHPLSDSYQTLMAERVEVLRGPASVLYGSNAMGGVINIVTRGANEPYEWGYNHHTAHASIGAGSWGTLQAETSYEGSHGMMEVTAAAQYGRSDNHRPHTGFEQYGGYLKLGYHFSPFWKVVANLDLTHWNASNPGSVTQPKLENDQYITRGAASLTIENRYHHTSGSLSIYDNFGRHKINDGYNAVGGKPQTDLFRSKDAVAGLSWYQSIVLGDARTETSGRLTVGVDYQHIYGRAYYTSRATGERVTTPQRLMQSAHAHENEVAGYVDYQQDINAQLTADVGLRYDHHSTAGGEWVPQAGLVWRVMPRGELKAMVSKGFRNPTTKDMYLYGSANHDSLHAERLWNYELSWHHRCQALTYGVNLFYIKGDNLIQTVAKRNVNTGEIENYGAELETSYRINSHWAVNTNHALLHMEHKVVAAPTYKGFLGASYQCCRWNVLAGLQYVNGLYTAVDDNEQKENFCLLNASVNYALTEGVSLWLRGENLLAQQYELNLGYPMPRATFMGGVNLTF